MPQRRTPSQTPRTKQGRQTIAEERAVRRRRDVGISVAVAVVFVLVLGSLLFIDATPGAIAGDDQPTPATVTDAALVREDSHRLSTAADGNVTFVEFLDFECEACRAAFPVVEQLRTTYGDRVTFVIRYFPLPSHFNAERAARAVEAAAQQGQLESMYRKMFETQASWGEQTVPADEQFRGFAEELGLDMAAFDDAYSSPATLDRINRDVADGTALGVTGTPTMFLNGNRLQVSSEQDLLDAFDAALR